MPDSSTHARFDDLGLDAWFKVVRWVGKGKKRSVELFRQLSKQQALNLLALSFFLFLLVLRDVDFANVYMAWPFFFFFLFRF